MIKKLRALIVDNFLIKLFALLFAVLLWMHASTRGESEVNFVVPLELKDIPANLTLAGDVPGFVDVRIKGNGSLLKGLSSRDVGAFISLKNAGVGESKHFLSTNNIKAPGGVDISRISPVEVKVSLDELVQKSLEIRPAVVGTPAAGYRMENVEVSPARVDASGSKHALEKLNIVYTEPVDIQGLDKGFEGDAKLDASGLNGVRLDVKSATVKVQIVKSNN